MNAANKGHLEIVQALLANGPIMDAIRGFAVEDAANNGHLEIVQALLANGPIEDWHRSYAAKCATRNGHPEIVRELLANEVRHRRYAVIDCCHQQ
jgi:ankyrin repeat protein